MTTLDEANAVMPLVPPMGMTPEQQAEFFVHRADMYRRVAVSDPDHHFEALACAGLEQENANLAAALDRRFTLDESPDGRTYSTNASDQG